MIPTLFEIPLFGGIPVHSFGLMMAVAFFASGIVLKKQFKVYGLSVQSADQLLILIALSGIIGAKLYYVLFESFGRFIQYPLQMLLSGAGLTWYGGFVAAAVTVLIFVRIKKYRLMPVLNSLAVALPLGYGIGRIGCHLSGDGDYGLPTTGWWGVNYSNGIVPPSSAFRGTAIAAEYPGGIVPDTVLCHPTPLYETFLSLVIFIILLQLSRKDKPFGIIPALYLLLAGLERFFVEFIRINHPAYFGLTQAQIISLFFIVAGMSWLFYNTYNKKISTASH